jgi:hypothetical protein
VKAVADTKLEQVEQKLLELTRFRENLKALSDICCGGPRSAEHCAILETLESGALPATSITTMSTELRRPRVSAFLALSSTVSSPGRGAIWHGWPPMVATGRRRPATVP